MSTLELSDLLNQEMVENPMLEEVPTEDLQPVDTAAQDAGKARRRGGQQGRNLGRPDSRTSSATTWTTATVPRAAAGSSASCRR